MTGQSAFDKPDKPAENEASWIWTGFVAMLQTGQVASIQIRPYHPALMDSLRMILANMSRSAVWQEWAVLPEVHRVEHHVHFMLDLTLNHERDTYCFSSLFFHLYHRTGHLKQQISFDDYRNLFEATWIDRAEKAGWKVTFAFQNALVQMVFQRK